MSQLVISNTIQSRLFNSLIENGDRVAIEYRNSKMSYKELDEASDKIASNLLSKGIEKGTFVSILLKDSAQLITTVLGVLKARCVFMPMDVSYPVERIKNMLNTTETKYIITDQKKLDTSLNYNNNVIENINFFDLLNNSNPNINSNLYKDIHNFAPDDSIYIFFTSGSTGVPKAVVGKNISLLHFIEWEIEEFDITKDIKVSQFTSPCHNPFLRDIFVPLLVGGTICIPESKESMLDSNRLMEWIEISQISLIHCTPSLFKLINGKSLSNDSFSNLQYVLFGGEKVVPNDLISWYETIGERVQLVSLYGQTETTLAKVYYRITADDAFKMNIPIGKPIPGAKVIILDKNLEICPQGITGEIYIRTPFRSLGYYNNSNLNRERFVTNPFNNDPNDIIYRTGDLGRMLPDENIEFLGRIDRQIKVRGFRVELDEIEHSLSINPKIRESAVVSKISEQGDPYICAYVTLNSDILAPLEQLKQEIREVLSLTLPDYMIPQYFIIIDKLPMNLNGKIDYRALPEPQEKQYVEPKDRIEISLAEIWEEVLGVKNVSRYDRFIESGGHSLNVIDLVYKVYEEYNIELPLSEIFKDISLEELANYIKQSTSTYS